MKASPVTERFENELIFQKRSNMPDPRSSLGAGEAVTLRASPRVVTGVAREVAPPAHLAFRTQKV